MATKRRWVLLAVVAFGVTACGGDGEAATTTATAPASSTTVAPTPAASTTAPPTTTTSTAAPDEAHPGWPVSWGTLWPADGSTATVRAATNEGTIDAQVGLDYGVEWDGGAWDRIWLGSPEVGQVGVSFYLQRPEPWVIVLWGAETHGAAGFYMTERFDPPLTLDLRLLPDEEVSGETTVVISDADGVVDEGPYALALSLVGFEAVEVVAGRFENTVHLHLTAEEPGGYVAETDIWIDAEQALVRLAPAHIWGSLELATLWSE
jgi:hypothetical protein